MEQQNLSVDFVTKYLNNFIFGITTSKDIITGKGQLPKKNCISRIALSVMSCGKTVSLLTVT